MFLLLACNANLTVGNPPAVDTATEDDAAIVYDPGVLHEVDITIAAADWDTLRVQERSYYDILGPGCMEGPFESPYTWFLGDVTFDGEALGTVGLRKKGLIGSLSSDRPSLKIDVDRETADARFHGLEKLVLNNNNQDWSRMRSCLAHAFFADAGLVAPRCSLAHVVVNGVDLGVYDNAESIDPDLVQRVRGAEPETMYEGTLSDFREGWLATFEAETEASDGAQLEQVTNALDEPDGALLDALDAVIDLDAYFTFWAAESLAGHWDGFNGNTNNFYVYAAPEDNRLEFIASGPDATFDSREPFGPGQPIWVATVSALSNRLIQHSEGRARYEAALQRLLDDVWDGEARAAQVDAWKELVRDVTSLDERRAIAGLRDIVEARGADVAEALGGFVPSTALRGEFCWTDVGSVRVDFATPWDSYPNEDVYTAGESTADYVISGVTYTPVATGVTAGEYDAGLSIWLAISEMSDGSFLAPYVVFDAALLEDGAVLPIDGDTAEGVLLYRAPGSDVWETAAYLGEGSLTFEAASEVPGAPLVGVLDAMVLGAGG